MKYFGSVIRRHAVCLQCRIGINLVTLHRAPTGEAFELVRALREHSCEGVVSGHPVAHVRFEPLLGGFEVLAVVHSFQPFLLGRM